MARFPDDDSDRASCRCKRERHRLVFRLALTPSDVHAHSQRTRHGQLTQWDRRKRTSAPGNAVRRNVETPDPLRRLKDDLNKLIRSRGYGAATRRLGLTKNRLLNRLETPHCDRSRGNLSCRIAGLCTSSRHRYRQSSVEDRRLSFSSSELAPTGMASKDLSILRVGIIGCGEIAQVSTHRLLTDSMHPSNRT